MNNNKSLEGIDFIDDKEREYFARAKIGIDVETFIRSDVGRFLHGRAKGELAECESNALQCDPNSWFGRRKLSKLRERAAPARRFMAWCAEAITDGRLAEQELENNN